MRSNRVIGLAFLIFLDLGHSIKQVWKGKIQSKYNPHNYQFINRWVSPEDEYRLRTIHSDDGKDTHEEKYDQDIHVGAKNKTLSAKKCMKIQKPF